MDEPALRTALARIVQDAGGGALAIEGAVRLELTPLPRLSIDRVAWGERDAGPFEADRVDVDVAPLPLLLGRIEPVRLQLVRPRLRLDGRPEGWADALWQAVANPALSGLGRITVIDGTFRPPERADGASPAVVGAVDLEITRQPERQRVTVDGTARIGGEQLRLAATAEPFRRDALMSLGLEVGAGSGERAAVLSFQGSLRPEASDRRAEGQIRVTLPDGQPPGWLWPLLGRERPLPAALPGPAMLQGKLVWTTEKLALGELELNLADTRLRGSLAFDRTRSGFELALEAAQATLTPELARSLRQAGAALELPDALHGRMMLQVGALAWRGDQIRRLRAEAVLEPGRRLRLPRLAATLPGETALTWTGQAAAPGEASLAGSLSLQAGDLRALLLWLGADPVLLPAGGLASLDLTAQSTLGPGGIALSDIDARLDASRIRGSLAFTAAARPRLGLALAVDRLNTALYWPTPRLPDPVRWRERLAALDLGLDLTVERIAHDALRGQDLRLRATVDDGRLDLAELRLSVPAGTRARLAGTADLAEGGDYDLNGEIAIEQPRSLLRLAGLEPVPGLDHLAPLRVSARLTGDASAAGVMLGLDGKGIAASLEGTLGGPFDLRFLDLTARASAGDAGRLLEALGWIVPPERPDLGAFTLSLDVRRDGGPAKVALESRIGGSDLEGEAVVDIGDHLRLDGRLQAGTLDTALIGAVYDTLALPLAFPPGSPWAWPGAWPRRPLDWSWLDRAGLKLEVGAGHLRHRGEELPGAQASIALADRELALSRLALPLAGGLLEGTLTLEHEADHAVLATDLRLSRARVEQLAAVLAPGSSLTGEIDLAAELVGQGLGIADLVASLAGDGSLALREGRLRGVTPPGEAAANGDAPGDLELSLPGGPLSIEHGMVTSPPGGLVLGLPGGEGRLGLRFDLPAWMMEVSLDGQLAGAEGDPFRLRLLGAPGRLRQVPPILPQPGPATVSP